MVKSYGDVNKVQASKPSGYRFWLSRNVSIFNLNQYCKLHIEFLHPLHTVYNPLQHPPLWSPSSGGGEGGGGKGAVARAVAAKVVVVTVEHDVGKPVREVR